MNEVKKALKDFMVDQYKMEYNLFKGSSKMGVEERTHKYYFIKKSKAIEDIIND